MREKDKPAEPVEITDNTVYVVFGTPRMDLNPMASRSNEVIVSIYAKSEDAFNAMEQFKFKKGALHEFSISRMSIQ